MSQGTTKGPNHRDPLDEESSASVVNENNIIWVSIYGHMVQPHACQQLAVIRP